VGLRLGGGVAVGRKLDCIAFAVMMLAAVAPAGAQDDLTAAERRAFEALQRVAPGAGGVSAEESLRRHRDPVGAKIATWLALHRPGSTAGFDEVARFIDENPTWPRQPSLQRRAEAAMGDSVSGRAVIDWFRDREPLTGQGMRALGEAYVAVGDRSRGAALIRRAWIEGDFSRVEEDRLEQMHGSLLGEREHIARLDHLLWDGQHDAAERMLRMVPPDWRVLAQARIQLRRGDGNGEAFAERVPARLKNDPGLLYERARWNRRKDFDAEAYEILRGSPRDLGRPQLWWAERQVVARRLIARGQAREAYSVVHNHGLPQGGEFADAEWLAGWIALRFANEPRVAMTHFERAFDAAETPAGKARTAYWAGRGADVLRDRNRAIGWYREAAQYHTSYYGQLAAGHDPEGTRGLDMSEPAPSAADVEAFNRFELTRAVKILKELRQEDLMRVFYLALAEASPSPVNYALSARLALSNERPDLAVTVARRAHRNGYALPESGYPVIPVPDGHPDRAMVLSIARQESNFRQDAVSTAGARGLMQVMPGTAQQMARMLGLPYSLPRLSNDWQYNLALGRGYLGHMLDMFSGSKILAFAAYNAGPGNVSRWIRTYGDPRSDQVDRIDWIELIPYNETRNYVQRIFENHSVYMRRLGRPQVASTLIENTIR